MCPISSPHQHRDPQKQAKTPPAEIHPFAAESGPSKRAAARRVRCPRRPISRSPAEGDSCSGQLSLEPKCKRTACGVCPALRLSRASCALPGEGSHCRVAFKKAAALISLQCCFGILLTLKGIKIRVRRTRRIIWSLSGSASNVQASHPASVALRTEPPPSLR
ncbi:hypothetical protein GN956_G9479 [Arapaima gigas]